MFTSNNRASLHLRLKENLVNPERVSKYYENNSLPNFFLHFMSLLRAKFLKNFLNKLEMLLIPNFDLGEKIRTAANYQ